MVRSLLKSINKFNEDFELYVKETGDSSLPTIDCTIIGFDPADKYSFLQRQHQVTVIDCDGNLYNFRDDDEISIMEVKEAIKYDRRRLAKAWRIWKSDNPDKELERYA